ncbi:MAG: dNTP triphosphohydrolase, partial [Lachnospiraceae bacterium]|nr:dNTP triphosphohydrolase [Lachnospiraceae bacterium]
MPSDCIRLFDEHRTLEAYRTEYRRDYARVIHSSSFRRLQNKTQLFPGYESDFFRNRLTHSLEVAQIAKTIAIMLSEEEKYRHLPIEPDVCEIAGLIHDLGHPPFGHNGEDALNSCMGTYGGFEGNAQTIRIITKLEKKTANDEYHNEFNDDKRYGLNLTTRAIASALKYDTMIAKDYNGDVKKGYYESEKEIVNQVKKTLIGENYTGLFKTIECQIMDLADDIAYSTYDIEDAFKAGFLTPVNMMAADDMIFEQIVEKLFTKSQINSNVDECRNVLLDIFKSIWDDKIGELKAINKRKRDYGKQAVNKFLDIYRLSNEFA